MDGRLIRNFVILAHVDHGKSTLADRFLELTGTVEKRKMRAQFLDMNPLEREKGITIKMQSVRMMWKPYHAEILNSNLEFLNKSGIQNPKPQNTGLDVRISDLEIANSEFILNLIDTPGHVDFSYEVSRALAAVEGAILLVDATQGVQAQTIANLNLAKNEKLVVIPAVNKIDLPSADTERTVTEIVSLLDVASADVLRVSAKTGEGVAGLLRAVVEKVPAPKLDLSIYRNVDISNRPLRALVFDSLFDQYQGIIAYVRIVDGVVKKGDRITFLATGATVEVTEAGIFSPERTAYEELAAGEIGYIATGIKEPEKVRVGDTITRHIDILKFQNVETLPGYREPTPMVFASVFPENQDDYEALRDGLKKLQLNDAALTFAPEESSAVGRGFRAGFLGMLHMEIVAERLRREYSLDPIFANPSVALRIFLHSGGEQMVFVASKMPPAHEIRSVEEPWVRGEIITPPQYLGAIGTLLSEGGGTIGATETLSEERLLVSFEAPLRAIIIDFHDRLKSATQGFASMAYELAGWQSANLVRLEILVAGERIHAFSEMVPREKSYLVARERVRKLKEMLPRELFVVALQAEVEGRIIARETIPALKKDVTGYLYGGDRTRKMKLWKKQQKGKKKLKAMGHVEIPPDVFLKMIKK